MSWFNLKFLSKNLNCNSFIFYSLFTIVLVFFIPNMWDGSDFDHAFTTGHLEIINIWAFENSNPFLLVPIYFLYFLKKTFNINHEFLFDLFTIFFFLLFCFEIKKICKYLLNLDNYYCNVCAAFAATFPIWESLVAIHLGLYIFAFYLVLIGHRIYIKENILFKILGTILILFSFTIKSNFSFIIGLSLAYTLKLYFVDNKNNYINFIIVLLLTFLCFTIDQKFFPTYGFFAGHNAIAIKNLSLINIFTGLTNYLSFFAVYLWIPLIVIVYFKLWKKFTYKILKKELIYAGILIVLFFTAIAPYILVNKYTDIFFFRDFMSRQAFLLTIPFSLFFTVLFEFIERISKKKIIRVIIIIFILQSLLICSIKYYFKIEASIFRENLILQLKLFSEPASGYIKFKNERGSYFNDYEFETYFPGHRLRIAELTNIFYKAYNKESWLPFIPLAKNGQTVNFETYKIFFKAKDFNYKKPCIIEITFENSLDLLSRIKKIYIINYEKYFLIKSIRGVC